MSKKISNIILTIAIMLRSGFLYNGKLSPSFCKVFTLGKRKKNSFLNI